MAKHNEPPPAEPGPGKPKKRLVLIGAAAAIALLIGAGAAWFFIGHKSEPQPATAQPKPKHSAPPVFVSLEPFVVNLAGDVQHYLQVGIDLRITHSHVPDQIKLHLPEIRNAVLLLLSSKRVEDLATVEQKNQLREEIREVVNKPIGVNTPAPKPNPGPEAPKAEGMSEARAAEPATAAPPKADPHRSDSEEGVVEVLLTSFVIQ
jgi:flagellar protein FliL